MSEFDSLKNDAENLEQQHPQQGEQDAEKKFGQDQSGGQQDQYGGQQDQSGGQDQYGQGQPGSQGQ